MDWNDLDEILDGSSDSERKVGAWISAVGIALLFVIAGLVAWSQFSKRNSKLGEQVVFSEEPKPLKNRSDNSGESQGVGSYLSEEEARYLQDAEHYGGFVLGDLAFPGIVDALKRADGTALLEFLSNDFSGSLFSSRAKESYAFPFGEFSVWKEDYDVVAAFGREGFVEELLRYRSEFEEIQIAGLKVIKMSPVEYGSLEGKWEGTCKLYFGGVTPAGTIAKRSMRFRCRVSQIASDTPDRRGWLEMCEVTSAESAVGPEQLLLDITSKSGIPVERLRDNWRHLSEDGNPYLTGGVYLCDFDSNGIEDILLTDVDDGVSLYRGEGGAKFTEVTEILGSRIMAQSAAFGDLDGDGDEDLLLENRIFENIDGIRFREKFSSEHSLRIAPDFAGHAIADFDRDGYLDIYAVGGFVDSGGKPMKWIGENQVSRNQLFRNLGNWKFEDVTETAGVRGSGSPAFAACWFDANGDNWPDLMSACYGPNDFYINQKDGTFRRGELPPGYGGFSMGIAIDDIDNDGLGDPYIGNMYSKAGERVMGNLRPGLYSQEIEELMIDFVTGNELFRNDGEGAFLRIGEKTGINDIGWAYGVGYGDLNGDGLPDVYSPVGFQSVSPNKPDG